MLRLMFVAYELVHYAWYPWGMHVFNSTVVLQEGKGGKCGADECCQAVSEGHAKLGVKA